VNRNREVIPKRTLTKAPSAELAPDQKDEDSLPPYEVLDPILEAYLEQGAGVEDLEKRWNSVLKKGFSVRSILAKLEAQEFKRRQSALVFKASPKAFGIGRRVPIAKMWYR
jgi:NAD+ synthase (glutamine-hydrolysing)